MGQQAKRKSIKKSSATSRERTTKTSAHKRPSHAAQESARSRAKRIKNEGNHTQRSSETLARSKSTLKAKRQKRTVSIIALVIVVLGVGFLIDSATTMNKIYQGVSVRDVDLSGKTRDEASDLILETFTPNTTAKEFYICANDEVNSDIEGALEDGEYASHLAEQQSVQDAKSNKVLWSFTGEQINAKVAAEKLAEEAYKIGRSEGGIPARLTAQFSGTVIEPYLSFDNDAIEEIASEIDDTLGEPFANYSVDIEEGFATVIPGRDGIMIDRYDLKQIITRFMLDSEDQDTFSFVAELKETPVQITEDMAQEACDIINSSLQRTLTLITDETSWTVENSQLAEWITTEVIPEATGHHLIPCIDEDAAKSSIIKNLSSFNKDTLTVTIEIEEGKPVVYPHTEQLMPEIESTLDAIDEVYFAAHSAEEHTGVTVTDSDISIEVTTAPVPERMSIEDAIDHGILTVIAQYTTEFAEAEARNNNIHLISDKLSNSIVKANGGSWSFNDIAGEATEEEGFQAAGSIMDGEYIDSIGGGICQVATTIFNAVYESGFNITERWNHSLYISSYPAGRDAAISYPYLDLIWENDSPSDVILIMSYTDWSVSAKIYGISPEYQTSTEQGEWLKGEAYTTKIEKDDSLDPGKSYTKTEGTDGRKISITRIVKDASGEIIRETTFNSTYEPKNEVIVEGPKKTKEDDTSKDLEGEENKGKSTDNEEG